MRAAFVTAPDTFTLEDIPEPLPAYGEVLLRVKVCGVCTSEVHLLRALTAPQPSTYTIQEVPFGPQPGLHAWHVAATTSAGHSAPDRFPLLLGHEISGIVEACGEGVSGIEVGQPVTALTQHGFAQYTTARAANIIPLPESIPLHLALGEPIACAANAAMRAGVQLGDTVVLVGAGFMGALLLQFVTRLGAARVCVIDPRPTARALARRLGADSVLDPGENDPLKAILSLTEGAGADVVVEATGNQPGLDLAATLTRTRGRLVIYGYHQGGTRTIDAQLWNLRGLDVVNAHQRSDSDYMNGMRAGITMLKHGKLDMTPLVTHRFPLEQIAEAFALAQKRPEGFVKAIVEPA